MKKVFILILMIAVFKITIGQIITQANLPDESILLVHKAQLLNDTLWLLDSTLKQQNTDSGFINRERTLHIHDQNGRLTSKIIQYMNINTQKWSNKSYDSVVFYMDTELITEKFTFSWNTNNLTWVNTGYSEKDINGNPIVSFSKNWDNISNLYTGGYRTRWEYNADGYLSSYYWEDFDTDLQDFVHQTKRTYYRNEVNQDTTNIFEKWNKVTLVWENYSLQNKTFNNEGLVSLTTNYSWNKIDSEWNEGTQASFIYKEEGLSDTTTYFFWLDDMLIWYPSDRYIGIYDSNLREIEKIKQYCDFPADNFVNESRRLYIYDNNVLVEQSVQKWSGTTWKDDYLSLFTYINDTILESQTFVNYNEYTGTHDTSFRVLTLFNSNLLPGKLLTQHWDALISEFETSSQLLFYWSPMLSPDGIFESEQLTYSTYPNPFTNYTTIEYYQDQPSNVTLYIYNHFGVRVKQIHKYQQSGKQKITWYARGFPSGMYYFTLLAGDQVAKGKMVLVR